MSRVLVACERWGRVRDAFIAAGHDAVSCDLEPTETPGPHIQADIRDVVPDGWDTLIGFPPCTFLASSGARWWKGRERQQADAVDFVRRLMGWPCQRIAIENPIGALSRLIRKPDQIIQPWQFWKGLPGTGEVKATCLWLKGLPKLVPTTPEETGRIARVHRMPPGPNRGTERGKTYLGIAEAMASQWGGLREQKGRGDERA